MDARLFVRHWWKFFPKRNAKVIESRDLIKLMKEILKKEALRHDRTAN